MRTLPQTVVSSRTVCCEAWAPWSVSAAMGIEGETKAIKAPGARVNSWRLKKYLNLAHEIKSGEKQTMQVRGVH